MQIGNEMDGSVIRSKEIVDFPGTETWDLLPAAETGVYLANDIWIASTLKQQVPVYTVPITD